MTYTESALVAFSTLLATIGPLETAVLFAALTPGVTRERRRQIAIKAILIATGILLFFTLLGGPAQQREEQQDAGRDQDRLDGDLAAPFTRDARCEGGEEDSGFQRSDGREQCREGDQGGLGVGHLARNSTILAATSSGAVR